MAERLTKLLSEVTWKTGNVCNELRGLAKKISRQNVKVSTRFFAFDFYSFCSLKNFLISFFLLGTLDLCHMSYKCFSKSVL